MADTVPMTLAEAETLCLNLLQSNGCDEANARAVTAVMIKAERDICASHGLFRLPGYVSSLRSGKVNGSADPVARDLSPAAIKVDGKGGFAPLALERGLPLLAARARETGIAVLAITDIFHFAALWPEAEWLAEEGLASLAWTAAAPMVAPAGGTKALFGTNPMAFGFPRPGGDPVVFDQASAAMARGDVQIHARDGKPVPAGIGIDPDGQPTTDPEQVLAGAQLPFGDYKGSNIALMVEFLAGALIGSHFSFEAGEADNGDGGPPVGGELVVAIDPNRMGDAEGWASHVERFAMVFAQQEGARLPGARRFRNRLLTPRDGIQVPAALHAAILALAKGIDP